MRMRRRRSSRAWRCCRWSRAALQDDRNWLATLPVEHAPVGDLAADRAAAGTTSCCIRSACCRCRQKVAPLGIAINKFGNQAPTGATTFDLTFAGTGTEEVREEFAIGNFVRLSDSDKLSRKSFETHAQRPALRDRRQLRSTARTSRRTVTYELSYVHRKRGFTLKAGVYDAVRRRL